MDTMAIYTYLATLKTGCTDSLENFKRYVTQGEIEFRAKFTQFMTEGDGKGANLILSDYMELKGTLNGCVKEVGNPYHEQFVYSLKKTKEAIDYIKKTIKLYASDGLPHIEDDNIEVAITEKEWITYDELVQMYDFRGVKSAKDASWRKRNGFDKCVSQSGGKGSAVKYSVSKINEWLTNGKVSKK